MKDNSTTESVIQEPADKLTFNRWIKGISHYKWWVIGSTSVMGIVGAVGVQFGFNTNIRTFNGSYQFLLATEKGTDNVERFVSGEVFNYSSILEKDNLESVVNSNTQFKKINVEKLIDNNALSIARENISEDKEQTEYVYTISAKIKYFPSDAVGKEFLKALLDSYKVASTKSIDKYDVTTLISSDYATQSYANRVKILNKQAIIVDNVYEKITDKFGGQVASGNQNQTLAQLSNDYDLFHENVNLLVGDFYTNGYVDYVEGKESERIEEIKNEAKINVRLLNNKEDELTVNKDLLDKMQSATIINTTTAPSEYTAELISLKNKISNLSKEISDLVVDLHWAGFFIDKDPASPTYGDYVFDPTDTNNACYHLGNLTTKWISGNKAYEDRLNSCATNLEQERVEACNAFKYVYSNYSNSVSVLNSGYIQVKGGIHWAIGLVAGLFLGFLVSSIVVGEIEINRKENQ